MFHVKQGIRNVSRETILYMQAVIFDFNGTLFQDTQIHYDIWKNLYRDLFGSDKNFKEIFAKVKGFDNENIINYFYKVNGQIISSSENERLSKLKEKMYRDHCIENKLCHLTKGAEGLLNHLKEKEIPINLASASIKENVDFFFEEFGIGRWFERDLVTYDDGILKNKTEMYLKACQNIKARPNECLVFEDSVYGLNSAKEAGIKEVIIIGNDKADFKDAKVISDFDEVDRSKFANYKKLC